MRFDQLAIYTNNIDRSIENWRRAGYDSWIEDTVTGEAHIGPEAVTFKARLAFNYEAMPDGMELELIQPLTKPNYINDLGLQPGSVAHIGRHVHTAEEELAAIEQLAAHESIQTTFTYDHTNVAIPVDRAYRYVIKISPWLPFPVKLIRRVERVVEVHG